MFMKTILTTYLVLTTAFTYASPQFQADQLYTGENLIETSLSSVVKDLLPGSIIIVSEYHAGAKYNEHQKKQLEFLKALKKNHPNTPIHVGMEFIDYTKQKWIDAYFTGKGTEAEFLKNIEWASNEYLSYKPLIHFPKLVAGRTIGINLPRTISGKISKQGVSALTPAEKKLLPPNFELGRAEYRDRFFEVMGGHVSVDAFDRYFAAQSSWDDTMAHTSVEFMKNHPNDFLVIIVGDFHNKYGGGLPDRILKRGHNNLITISQESIQSNSQQDIKHLIGKDKNAEARADFIWISN